MAAVLMASLSKARESGRNVKCINNLKQIGLSVQLYADENSLQLPPFYYSTTAVGGGQYALTNNLGWSGRDIGPGALLSSLSCPSDKYPTKTRIICAGKTNSVPISYCYNFLMYLEGTTTSKLTLWSTILLFDGRPDVTSAGTWWTTPDCTPDASGNVTICHQPGTPAQATMSVNSSALGGHLGHGDYCGPCNFAASPVSSSLFTNLTVFVRRHLHGGNALYLDGHVEQITAISTNSLGAP